MNFKKRSLFIGTLVAVLSLTLVSVGGAPEVSADKDDDDRYDLKWFAKKFYKQPHFKTADCRLADPAQKSNVEAQLGITVNPDGTLPPEVDCKVKAWFDKKAQELKYKVKVVGMDVIDDDGNILDDIGKSHFHKAAMFVDGNPDNPKGPKHVLNILGQPAMDDGNLVVKPTKGVYKGIWDDGDAVDRDGDNDDTFEVTSDFVRESLCKGEIFLMVHGQVVDGDGNILKPGFIKAAIQPTDKGEKFCEKRLGIDLD